MSEKEPSTNSCVPPGTLEDSELPRWSFGSCYLNSGFTFLQKKILPQAAHTDTPFGKKTIALLYHKLPTLFQNAIGFCLSLPVTSEQFSRKLRLFHSSYGDFIRIRSKLYFRFILLKCFWEWPSFTMHRKLLLFTSLHRPEFINGQF